MPIVAVLWGFLRPNLMNIVIVAGIGIGTWVIKDIISTYMENVALKSDISTLNQGIRDLRDEQQRANALQQQTEAAIRDVLTRTGDSNAKLAADLAAIRSTKNDATCALPAPMATAFSQLRQPKPGRSKDGANTSASHATPTNGANPVPSRSATPGR